MAKSGVREVILFPWRSGPEWENGFVDSAVNGCKWFPFTQSVLDIGSRYRYVRARGDWSSLSSGISTTHQTEHSSLSLLASLARDAELFPSR